MIGSEKGAACLAVVQADLLQGIWANKVWNQSFLHPPISYSLLDSSHLLDSAFIFSLFLSLPFPPSESWRRMDKVCTSPWLNCRSADVAPSPLTAWWRLYLSLYDAVARTDTQARSYRNTLAGACLCWHLQKTLNLHTEKCPCCIGTQLYCMVKKNKTTHTHKGYVHTPTVEHIHSLSLSVYLMTPLSLHSVSHAISISLYCHTHAHNLATLLPSPPQIHRISY